MASRSRSPENGARDKSQGAKIRTAAVGGGKLVFKFKSPRGIPLKLFVGQIPLEWDESRVKDYFSQRGEVMDVLINKTNKKEGATYAFVKFASMSEAEDVITQLTNEPTTLPGASGPVQIRWADGETQRLGIEPSTVPRLYVGSIPHDITEENLHELFQKHGRVTQTNLVKDDNDGGMHKSYGFVTYEKKESALMAVQDFNERAYLNHATKPIEVRIADKKQNQPSGQQPQQASNPYATGVGTTPAPMPAPVQYQRYYQYYDESNQPYYVDTVTNQTQWGMAPAQPEYKPQATAPSNARQVMNFGANKPGGVGCNLFIYYIPTEWSVQNLVDLFGQYGHVVSARIVASNGVSKGYGFVTYEHPEEAQAAISNLDHYHVPGSKKRLKVSLKTEKPGDEVGTSFSGLDYKFTPFD